MGGSHLQGAGDCSDNACSETLFASLKVERLYDQRFRTIREAKDEILRLRAIEGGHEKSIARTWSFAVQNAKTEPMRQSKLETI